MRTVLGFLRRRACLDGVIDGRSGAAVIIQRFGGALNLNIHLHALVLDGVFAIDGPVTAFHPMARLTREDVAGVVALIARRVTRLPVLAAAAAASVDGRVAFGPRAGARVRRCGDPPEEVTPETLGPCHAQAGGFNLHAGLLVRAGQRDRLERLCRYALRPPLAQERLQRTADGEISMTTPGEYWMTVDRLDVLACPRCGGRLRLAGLIEQRRSCGASCGTWGCRPTYPSRAPRGRHLDTLTRPRSSRNTPPNLTPLGRHTASLREGCRYGVQPLPRRPFPLARCP